MSVEHYENFPVASLLCPAALRAPVRAIYAFARTADDLADEGDATPAERLAALADYRRELRRVSAGLHADERWAGVFEPLRCALYDFCLPVELLDALLDAFEQDATQVCYRDRSELLSYCSRSANPVGRLMLHLYRVDDPSALAQSDAICTALQLINFWQDLRIDSARGRIYLPEEDRQRHGLGAEQFLGLVDDGRMRAAVADVAAWAGGLMRQGAPLVHRVGGRAGWELRLVVQGGLRILDKIAAADHATMSHRPAIDWHDLPLLFWRAARMTGGSGGVLAARAG